MPKVSGGKTKFRFAGLAMIALCAWSYAKQTDLVGPPGSIYFGAEVTALPNGYFAVLDTGGHGALHVYSPSGQRVSTLSGSTDGDFQGASILALNSHDFVLASPHWNNNGHANAGAVTRISSEAGLQGLVSASNSFVGSTSGDSVGFAIKKLRGGGYVIVSPFWAPNHLGAVTYLPPGHVEHGVVSSSNSLIGSHSFDGDGLLSADSIVDLNNGNFLVANPRADVLAPDGGALTWVDGTRFLRGTVTAANSLVGSHSGDQVGNHVVVLSNGNYVVACELCDFDSSSGLQTDVGMVAWGNGTAGKVGVISTQNSLHGLQGDRIGSTVIALGNGHYVVGSPFWDNRLTSVTDAGSATWIDGTTGLPIDGSYEVSYWNSLIGGSPGDNVGWEIVGLTNGNYVVASPFWSSSDSVHVGAATWARGDHGVNGYVSPQNSLVGSVPYDELATSVVALTNGNYVVGCPSCSSPTFGSVGAATWGSGTDGITGAASIFNSMYGAMTGDSVGLSIVALSNGNYVVGSYLWDNSSLADAGAATWVNGATGLPSNGDYLVSSLNSLVGGSFRDRIGSSIVPLTDGNYVVQSAAWTNASATAAGAVTWVNGTTGHTIDFNSYVEASNSLLGISPNDGDGQNVVPLPNGSYVVGNPSWDENFKHPDEGAATWCDGSRTSVGVVSLENSLAAPGNGHAYLGREILLLANGDYVVRTPLADYCDPKFGCVVDAGAITLGRASGGVSGPPDLTNTVFGMRAGGGDSMMFDYNLFSNQLIVGRPKENLVTLLE